MCVSVWLLNRPADACKHTHRHTHPHVCLCVFECVWVRACVFACVQLWVCFIAYGSGPVKSCVSASFHPIGHYSWSFRLFSPTGEWAWDWRMSQLERSNFLLWRSCPSCLRLWLNGFFISVSRILSSSTDQVQNPILSSSTAVVQNPV